MIAGIYVRTSTVRQGEEGTSLETQENQSRLKAVELGYQVDPAYIWRDMESGAYIDRAGVKRMLEAVKSREVDIVIVYDHDRLSRDPLDLLNIQRVCIEARVSLEFVREPSDTTPEGQKEDLHLGIRSAEGAAPVHGTHYARQGTGCQERPHAHHRRRRPVRVRLRQHPAEKDHQRKRSRSGPDGVPVGFGRYGHASNRLHVEREKRYPAKPGRCGVRAS